MNQSRGGGGEDTVVSDLEAMGAPPEIIEQFTGDQDDDDFQILPENWEALNLFMGMDTQWRTMLIAAAGGFVSQRTGIEYTSLESLMRMRGTTDTADAFNRVRIMESAALEAMAQS